MEKIWERAQLATIAGIKVLVLSPEDLLLHLCLHLAFHHLFQFAGLRTLCDVRETVNHYSPQLDWKQVWHRTSEWGVCNAVYLTLLLARDVIDAQIPHDVMENLKPDGFDQQLREWALEQIFQETNDTLSLSPYFWQLWGPSPLREKLASLRKLLFPPPEFVSQKYPVSFGSLRNYLYYFVRLKDQFMPYIRALWQILVRDKEMRLLVNRQNRNIVMREQLLKN